MTERYSVNVLRECIDLQNKKANDYQNPNSMIKQADYYPSGCLTILEIIHAKVLRMRSVMEAMQNDPDYKPNFESLEDSAKDLINYASFFVSYSRGKIDGQDPDRDFLNRKMDTKKTNPTGITRLVDTDMFSNLSRVWQELDGHTRLDPEYDNMAFVGATGAIGSDQITVTPASTNGGVGGSGFSHPGITADLKDEPLVWNISNIVLKDRR